MDRASGDCSWAIAANCLQPAAPLSLLTSIAVPKDADQGCLGHAYRCRLFGQRRYGEPQPVEGVPFTPVDCRSGVVGGSCLRP